MCVHLFVSLPKQTCPEEQRMLFENWARGPGLGPSVISSENQGMLFNNGPGPTALGQRLAQHIGRRTWLWPRSRTVQKEQERYLENGPRPQDLVPTSGATTWLDELASPPKQTCSEEQRLLFEK